MKKISTALYEMTKSLNCTSVVRSRSQGMFFCVDNTVPLNANSELKEIQLKMFNFLFEDLTIKPFDFLRKGISLRWITLMDMLMVEEDPFLPISKIEEMAVRVGISQQELGDMLRFYHSIGSLQFFPLKDVEKLPELGETERPFEDLVILKSEWLVGAFTAFMFDPSDYSAHDYLFGEARQPLEKYIATGIISQKLLTTFWTDANYKDQIPYLLQFCQDQLVFTEFSFVGSDPAELHRFIVPGMLPDIPMSKANVRFNGAKYFLVDFGRQLPKNIFHRLLCFLLEKCAKLEGIPEPMVASSWAVFDYYREKTLVMELLFTEGQIKITVDEFDIDMLPTLLEDVNFFVKEVNSMRSQDRFSSNTKDLKILLPYDIVNNNSVETITLPHDLVAEKRKQTDTTLLKVKNTTYDLRKFNVYFADEMQKAEAKEAGVKSQVKTALSQDVFLAHAWGKTLVLENGSIFMDDHSQVVEVDKELHNQGITTWLDETNLFGKIDTAIMEGVRTSKVVFIFISRNYIERVEQPNTYCSKEFHYIMKHKDVRKVVAIDMEDNIFKLIPDGSPLDFHFPEMLHIKMRNGNGTLNITELVKIIRKLR